MGKQRNAFGSYIVVNKDLQSLEFWGYEHTDAANTQWKLMFTTDVDASVQFLGAHEFYWWPYMQFLLARTSDGSSFRFYRFDTNFQTTAANEAGALIKDKIQYVEERLFEVPGRLTVPPVFWGKLAYFYTSESDNSANLRVYEYNPIIKAPQLLKTLAMPSETSQLYHGYTMINVGENGIIFKAQGAATFTRYVWNPNTNDIDQAAVTNQLTDG